MGQVSLTQEPVGHGLVVVAVDGRVGGVARKMGCSVSFFVLLSLKKGLYSWGVEMPCKVCGYCEQFHSEPSGMVRDAMRRMDREWQP